MSSKLIELRKPPSSALVEEVLKLEAFKNIKQDIVSTTVTESQMTTKYLKDVSKMLPVVSTVRKIGLNHINYARHNTYEGVCLNNLFKSEKSVAKGLITNGYIASSSGLHSILLNISIKKQKKLLIHVALAISGIHTVKRSTKTYTFTTRHKHLITG